MRKKFIEQVYMREVKDKFYYVEKLDEINGSLAIKYVKDIEKPLVFLCNGQEYVGLDVGYSILEYVPQDRGYNCRVFFDRQNRPMIYYFDINNGVGTEDGSIWYDDLYLDVILHHTNVSKIGNYISLDDYKELAQAKEDGLISQQEFDKANQIAKNLMTELKNNENDIVNRSIYDIFRLKKELNLK